MSLPTDTPFDSIEGSHRYISMLSEAIEEARGDVEAELEIAEMEHATRRKEALQIVALNLNKLAMHITASRRVLNDLRSLHRLLLEERPMPEGLARKAAE